MDSKLNFLQHFAETKRSCTQRINILRILGCRLERSSRSTLLSVGEALVFPKLAYGIGITSRNLEDLERILAPTYNEIVRQASGAFRTSPIVAVMAESSCLPFRLKIIQRLATLAIRLLEKSATAIHLPVVRRAADLLQETTGSTIPNVSPIIRLTNRKWYIKSPSIDNTLRNSIKAGSSSQTVVPKFAELIRMKYSEYNKIYTDGSKGSEKTGIGICSTNYKFSACLPEGCSVFSAA